jgi:hypothetical protein
MTEDARRPRPRKAVGPDRPTYFGTADVDRVMAILLAAISELASVRERLDTHERIAAAGDVATPAAVEAYRPDAAVEAERDAWRDAYIHRLFRVITEDVEALSKTAE